MAPGFDQICMSRPCIIYLDLAAAPPPRNPSPYSTLIPRLGDATRRDALGVPLAGVVVATTKAEGRTEDHVSSNGRLERGGWVSARGGESRVNAGYARTLTPPDYPMNRNVIYGSFRDARG